MSYKQSQYLRQINVLASHPELFDYDKGNGYFRNKKYPFVLSKGINNLFEPIRDKVLQYFKVNGISWWGGYKPSGHMLSSQMACLNHLFFIREDDNAVLELINNIRPGLHFTKVLPLTLDKDQKYIAFEAVSKYDHMNEDGPTRGANCTSIDALIAAVSDNGERWLIPIEWKYTESYPPIDKSQEGIADKSDEKPPTDQPKEGNADKTDEKKAKGEKRLENYSGLIDASKYLVKYEDYAHTPYFFEPFYQLMRQTLWTEQMIEHKDTEWIKADRFIHIHVIPSDNASLLNKEYSCTKKEMEESWKSLLLLDCYQTITPEKLLSPLKGNDDYSELINYLQIRYW